MTSTEIRQRFLTFFKKRHHAIIPSAPLVPKNDPSVLFNTAGMQPLVPYLLGQPHPEGTRLASCQKCVRTVDIDEVGDNRHLTFFEMLGNWSLGDYFKEDAIKWSYEFLTSKEEGLGLDPARLYITVFAGDENAPRDEEAAAIWSLYVPKERIYYLPAKNNWWGAGASGPCGPDTEMFYDVEGTLGDLSHDAFVAADDTGKVVEIWNDVFMEYESRDTLVIGKLAQKNVDTGSGLERITMVVQKKTNVFETDLFAPALAVLKDESRQFEEQSARVIADHIRTSLLLLADGVSPSNKDQGYILRRLIRRAVVRAKKIELHNTSLIKIIEIYQQLYRDVYPEVADGAHISIFTGEVEKFQKTLVQGLREFEKGTDPFILATTYGFPIEITEELARERSITLDRALFDQKMKLHQDTSRVGAEQKFKGGLANTGEQTTKLHTAHHLLLAALQRVLGPSVHQRGSNITDERLRIDFNFERKLTEEEKHSIERWVNEAIVADYRVIPQTMPRRDAEMMGAEMEFGTKYPDTVTVYIIEDNEGNHISKEFCGGPHVSRTSVLGTFRILKEEAVASGIRRIKATLT